MNPLLLVAIPFVGGTVLIVIGLAKAICKLGAAELERRRQNE